MSLGSSDERTRQRGSRGSHGISKRAPPPGSSLRTPTMAPRRREGSRTPTTLAVARSSGRSASLLRSLTRIRVYRCPPKFQQDSGLHGGLGPSRGLQTPRMKYLGAASQPRVCTCASQKSFLRKVPRCRTASIQSSTRSSDARCFQASGWGRVQHAQVPDDLQRVLRRGGVGPRRLGAGTAEGRLESRARGFHQVRGGAAPRCPLPPALAPAFLRPGFPDGTAAVPLALAACSVQPPT